MPRPTRSLTRFLALALTCALVMLGLASVPAQAKVPSKAQWVEDVHDAMVGAWGYVDRRVARAEKEGVSQLAVNFDIDNTALASHYAYGKPVRTSIRFARHLRKRNVSVLFNTGRITGEGRLRKARKQLVKAGYTVTEICGRTSSRESLAHSKKRCRQHFVDEGYTIIANVGNRSTDFTGGNYERAYRLPNYHGQLA